MGECSRHVFCDAFTPLLLKPKFRDLKLDRHRRATVLGTTMNQPCQLALAILNTESSYAQEVERPAAEVPDTIQFWVTPSAQWRIRTYALDHDIHVYALGSRTDGSSFTTEEALAHTTKHYSEIILSVIVLTFRAPNNEDEVRRILAEHQLTGSLEVGKSGVAFYNPDGGTYRTKSQPN